MPILELSLDASGAVTGAKTYDAAARNVAASSGRASSSVGKISTSFEELRSKVNSVGPVIIASVAAIGGGFAALAGKALGLASDMEETQNKFNVVFKGMEQTAEGWATELQKNYIMSREESKRFLASTQDLLKPMGVAADEAGKMSFEVAKLSADLGSFNNLETAQVMDDIQSALVGNFETMKKYGVVLNQAVVEEKARAMGLIEGKEKLDAAGRAEAAYALIVEGSKDAIGDIIETQGSYANQQKLLTANIKDTIAVLGEAFLPMATEVLKAVNEWIQQEENLNKIINGTVEVLRFIYNGFKGLVLAAKGVIAAVGFLAEAFVKGFRAMLLPVDLLMKALQEMGAVENNPLDLLEQGVTNFKNSAVDGFKETWKSIEEGNKYFDKMKTNLKESASEMGRVKTAAEGVADAVAGHTDTMMKQIPVYDFVKNAAGEYKEVLVGWRTPLKEVKEAVDEKTEAEEKNEKKMLKAAEAAEKLKTQYVALDTGARGASAAVGALTSAIEVQNAVVRMSGGGGGDLGKTSSISGSVSAHGGALSNAEWQALPQWQKDFLTSSALKGTTTLDYFSRPGDSRFVQSSGYNQQALAFQATQFAQSGASQQASQAGITNIFNQQISRSDVTNIVEEMTRSEARA